jgi:hypothetical protein
MKRLLLTVALLLGLALGAEAQTTKDFNFRTSDATYCDGSGETCNDGANTTYVNDVTDTYPVLRNGITFGWTVTNALESRDRDNSIDARFAGINFVSNATSKQIFRVDVTPGDSIDIRFAAGDFASGQQQYIVVKDNTTAFITCTNVVTNADEYADAGCAAQTRAAWPGSNTLVTRTMVSSTLFLENGADGTDSNSTTLAHLSLVITSGGGGGGGGIPVRHRVIN